VKWSNALPYFPNIFERYFEASEFECVRDYDDKLRLMVLPCANPHRLSRKLTAIKGNNIFVYDALQETDRFALQSGTMMLAIDLCGEMFSTHPDMIDGLHEGLAEIGIKPSHVFVMNSDATAAFNYQQYCDARGITNRVSILTIDSYPYFFLANQRITADDFQMRLEGTLEQRSRNRNKRLFLNFNGRSRPHRIYTVLLLMAHGLMDRGWVSLLDYVGTPAGTALCQREPDQISLQAAKMRSTFARWPRADISLPYLEALLEKLPMELDLPAKESVIKKRYATVTAWEMQNFDLYHNSYLSLVTDTTLSNDNSLFVTEKVYKCFVGFHPFIYLGSAGALHHLRSLGFQTFEPFVDESYDLEPDCYKRLIKAIDELRRLASLSNADLDRFYEAVWPRVQHNAWHACVDAPVWVKSRLDTDIRQHHSLL